MKKYENYCKTGCNMKIEERCGEPTNVYKREEYEILALKNKYVVIQLIRVKNFFELSNLSSWVMLKARFVL